MPIRFPTDAWDSQLRRCRSQHRRRRCTVSSSFTDAALPTPLRCARHVAATRGSQPDRHLQRVPDPAKPAPILRELRRAEAAPAAPHPLRELLIRDASRAEKPVLGHAPYSCDQALRVKPAEHVPASPAPAVRKLCVTDPPRSSWPLRPSTAVWPSSAVSAASVYQRGSLALYAGRGGGEAPYPGRVNAGEGRLRRSIADERC